MSRESHRLNRITSVIVIIQAILVVVLLVVTLTDVSRRAESAEIAANRTSLLIEQNQTLIETLQTQQAGSEDRTVAAVEAVFCALLIPVDERTEGRVQDCLDNGTVFDSP